MQVLSGEKYSVDTLLDPAVNIAIGTAACGLVGKDG